MNRVQKRFTWLGVYAFVPAEMVAMVDAYLVDGRARAGAVGFAVEEPVLELEWSIGHASSDDTPWNRGESRSQRGVPLIGADTPYNEGASPTKTEPPLFKDTPRACQ